MREARRAFRRVACAMTRASACGSSWLSVESRRVALATIATTPSRADAPRRRPVAAVRHATAAERHLPPIGRADRRPGQTSTGKCNAPQSESDRASFAAYDVEFVVEISRRAPLHRSTSDSHTSSRAGCRALHLYSSTALYTLHPLHPPSGLWSVQRCPEGPEGVQKMSRRCPEGWKRMWERLESPLQVCRRPQVL